MMTDYWKVKEIIGVSSVKFTKPMIVLLAYKCREKWYKRVVVFDDTREAVEVYDNANVFLEKYGGKRLYVVGPVSGELEASEIAEWLLRDVTSLELLEKETIILEEDAAMLGWCNHT